MSIPVRIHPLFWLLAALIGWLSTAHSPSWPLLTLVWVVIIFLSVLFHEVGHALTARLFGQKCEIHLLPFGGLTKRTVEKLRLSQEFLIVLNGPLFSLLLYFLAEALLSSLAPSTSLFSYALSVTAGVNLFWTFVNLLPVQPLDGGQLMRITLQGIFGFRGVKVSLFLSTLLSLGIALFFFAQGFMIGGALFFLLMFENYRNWKEIKGMVEEDQDRALWQQLTAAEMALKSGRSKEAYEQLQGLSARLKEGVVSNLARQMMSEILLEEKRYKEAYELIAPIIEQLSREFLSKAQEIAYNSGHIDEAAALGVEAYQENPRSETALINAYCYAKKGEVTPTVGWLQRAKQDGIPNFRQVLHSEIFDAVRRSKEFQSLQ